MRPLPAAPPATTAQPPGRRPRQRVRLPRSIGSTKPNWLALAAPETDMLTTYAEWELYVPTTQHLLSFGGNMTVARGTTYGLHDAWLECIRFYDVLWQNGAPVAIGLGVCLLLAAVVVV